MTVNQLAFRIALAFYIGNFSSTYLVKYLPYLKGGVITLIGLTVDDFVGESVISTCSSSICTSPSSKLKYLVDESLSNLPGCYPQSVPAVIAGFW